MCIAPAPDRHARQRLPHPSLAHLALMLGSLFAALAVHAATPSYSEIDNGTVFNNGQFTNAGTLLVQRSGILSNSGTFNNAGNLSAIGRIVNESGATLTNTGIVSLERGGSRNAGTIHNLGNFTLGGAHDFTGGRWVNGRHAELRVEERLRWGDVKSGTFVLGEGGSLKAYALTNVAGHTQVNAGAIFSYGLTNEKGSAFINNGAVVVDGPVNQHGTWIGSGSHSQSGPLRLTGVMIQDAVRLGTSTTISQGGMLSARTIDTHYQDSIKLAGGTITSPGHVDLHYMQVAGEGNLINADVTVHEQLVNAGQLVVNGRADLHSIMSQTGPNSLSAFNSLEIGTYGDVRASGHVVIAGDFINHSASGDWSTIDASLTLMGPGTHEIALAGQDLGATWAGLAPGNFAWQEISFADDAQWTLTDGNATAGAALYTRQLSFLGGLDQIKDLSGNYNIYYDPAAAGNEVFGGKTYAFGNGTGQVIAISAVPEPGTLALCVAGFAVMLRRRMGRAQP